MYLFDVQYEDGYFSRITGRLPAILLQLIHLLVNANICSANHEVATQSLLGQKCDLSDFVE